jgi:hypothetical protein
MASMGDAIRPLPKGLDTDWWYLAGCGCGCLAGPLLALFVAYLLLFTR